MILAESFCKFQMYMLQLTNKCSLKQLALLVLTNFLVLSWVFWWPPIFQTSRPTGKHKISHAAPQDSDPSAVIDIWLSTCRKVFFDLGANNGDTVRRWFSSSDFVGRSGGAGLKQVNGEVFSMEERSKYCMLSVEPNPKFTAELRKLEVEYRRAGFELQILAEHAAASRKGYVTLYLDKASHTAYGSSIYAHKVVNVPVTTSRKRTINRFHNLTEGVKVRSITIADRLAALSPGTFVIMKMDIEGGEYEVLPNLISAGVICKIHVLIIEWHGHKLGTTLPSSINETLEWLLSNLSCHIEIIHDD